MVKSEIMREHTAALSVVTPEAVLTNEAARTAARNRAENEARAAGYAAGHERARAEATAAAEHARSEQISALNALATAVAKTEDLLELERRRLQQTSTELAFKLAEAILTRELELSTSPGRDAITRALAAAPAQQGAIVRLHPADAAILDTSTLHQTLTVVADPAIGAGGCVLEIGSTLVDARIETALDRVRNVLREAAGA